MSDRQLAHELIRASAGTGKTYELTNRYLRLLRMGERPDEILASTFTRKAAGEILGRVLLRLAQAATSDQKLAEMQTALSDTALSRDECLGLLAVTARRLHRLRIGTLDSFFAQLAGSFALEIGLPPGWRIAEEHEDAALCAQASDAVLDSEDAASLLTLVHALTRGETTRSLDREVRDKVNTLYTVYRESERDAWHRVPRMRELSDKQLAEAIETLRTVALPNHKTWAANHAKDVESAEAGDWSAFVKGGIAGKVVAGETSYCRKPIETAVAAAYQTLLDHAKAVHLNQLANQTEATFQLLDKFHAQYQRLKTQTRALRFDDVTFRLAETVDKVRAGDTAFRLDAHLHHLLLDEFQDTSLAQWSVIRPFAQRVTGGGKRVRRGSPDPAELMTAGLNESGRPTVGPVARSGDRPQHEAASFFCVGDTKQAIYGWRGGVAEIFDAVTRELNDIQQRPLDTSWRSSPKIVAAVNQIFQNLHRHSNLAELADSVERWQQQFNEHQTAQPKQGLNGYVCLQAARSANDEEADTQKEITLRYAAERVAEWRKKAPGFNIGVLVRRNDAVRRLIYELRELGIEASEEGGSSLDDSAAVRLALSLIQLADHPSDTVARFHVATSPLAESARLVQLAASSQQDDPVPLSAVEFASKAGDAAAGRLSRRIRRQLVDVGYGPTVYALAGQLAPACNRRELRRLEKLIGLAYQYDDAATSRPRDFVEYVSAAKVRDPIAADVRVMTVHQAKGLEFDIVVLADLEADLIGQRGDLVVGRPSPTEPIDRICRRCSKEVQQLMPESWQRLFRQADQQDVSESLCVLYVAATRAVHALHMIVAPSAENERSLHKTFGGLLRAALTDGGRLAPEQIGYETGDREWFDNPGVEREPSAAEVAEKVESLAPLEVNLAAPAKQRWRGLQRVSPSSLEGGAHVRLPDEWSKSSTDRAAALARGTLIHAWFEQIHWLDDGAPSDDQLCEAAARLPDLAFSPEDIDRQLADFRAMLAHPNISPLLKRSAYDKFSGTARKMETERPIAIRDGDRILAGNIDRLVTVYDNDRPIAADIIDFKTDAIAAGDNKALKSKVEFYRPQIQAYRKAVATLLRIPTDKITAHLLFVAPGMVESVSE